MTSLDAKQEVSINLPLLVAILSSVIVSRGFGMEVWQSILIGAATFVICAALAWLYKSKLQIWFKSPEKLCGILFIQVLPSQTIIHEEILRVSPDKMPKTVNMQLYSSVQKQVSEITIRFGKKMGYWGKVYAIILNRFKEQIVFTSPSPNWWSAFRLPTVIQDDKTPRIRRIMETHTGTEIGIMSGVDSDGNGHIRFDEPIKIPRGKPFGADAIQIDIEILAENEWNGVLELVGNVDGVTQFAIRRVKVSREHGIKR
ncbi:MAG TPA: hypothetical protein G4O10_10070 [Dehalococcoidia bacterium]|nr:hypothetical protein [Dehalococcoidia bacterium]